ncbi:hypothetical protein ACROYT_G041602 [Oculina patagonica]
MELKRVLIFVILGALLVVGQARPSFEEDREKRDEGEEETEILAEEEDPDTAEGGESASGEEPTTPPPPAGGASPTPPAGGAPPPPAGGAPPPPANPIVGGVNQACADFQACAAQGDPSMCLQQMMTALTTLQSGAGAGGTPCQTPCQGGAVSPMPMPMPQPMPVPYPYPEQVIVEPASCGGTYPCKDKATKSKHTKHHKKHHKE